MDGDFKILKERCHAIFLEGHLNELVLFIGPNKRPSSFKCPTRNITWHLSFLSIFHNPWVARQLLQSIYFNSLYFIKPITTFFNLLLKAWLVPGDVLSRLIFWQSDWLKRQFLATSRGLWLVQLLYSLYLNGSALGCVEILV